jgi:cystathionine beta-lyase/cystathionine gamma-synthase
VPSGMLFASGLAATTTLTHLLSAGDHIIAMDDVYGGLYALCCLNYLYNFKRLLWQNLF